MLVDGDAKDVMVTSCFTGVNASFLRPSLVGNGLDPANLAPATQGGAININNGGANGKAWRDIWSAGQGIGAIKSAGPAGEWIDRSEEHTYELQSLMRISYAVFCLKNKKK